MGKVAIKIVLFTYLLFMLVLCTIAVVNAAEVGQTHKLSWTMATTRTDGSVLKPAEITGVDVRYGSKPVAMANKFIATAAAPALKYEVPTGAPGTYCYQVRTVTATQKSDWSTEKCADVLALPNPPQITIELVLQVTQ